MKVTVAPDGTVELDVANGETSAAVGLLRELQADRHKSEAEREKHSYSAAMASLSGSQRETWETLRDLDSDDGVHVSGMSQILEITESAVGQRLSIMEHRGLVYRVARGRYRAVQPDKGNADV